MRAPAGARGAAAEAARTRDGQGSAYHDAPAVWADRDAGRPLGAGGPVTAYQVPLTRAGPHSRYVIMALYPGARVRRAGTARRAAALARLKHGSSHRRAG
jgi:hypothetical protein